MELGPQERHDRWMGFSESTGLRLIALPFAPTAGDHVTAVGDTGKPGNKQQRLQPYDGKHSWEAYKMQLDLLAGLNHWTENEKRTHLAISLSPTWLVQCNGREAACLIFVSQHASIRHGHRHAHACMGSLNNTVSLTARPKFFRYNELRCVLQII